MATLAGSVARLRWESSREPEAHPSERLCFYCDRRRRRRLLRSLRPAGAKAGARSGTGGPA